MLSRSLQGRAAVPLCALVVAALTPSCVGRIGSGDDGSVGGKPGENGLVDVATASLRRMTPEQYTSTMRDLFGDPGLQLELDPDTGQVVTLLAVDKLNTASETIVSRRGSWTTKVFPCDTSGADDEACVDSFVRTFGRRAFRRTLDEADVTLLKNEYAQARKEQSFDGALLVVLKLILQSPEVYYFLELGHDGNGSEALASGVVPLTGWERATRLSYFLWNTTPDDELLAAAESGALDTIDGVKQQAERLLKDDRARATMIHFFVDWLELDGTNKHGSLEDVPKSATLFPEDSPALRAAMRGEIQALAEHVVFEGDGRFETLLTTKDAYVNGPLAKLYGVQGPADESTFSWVSLPGDQRAGLFTRAAFLSVFGSVEVKSPIRRGAYVLQKALCKPLGPPPPNAADVPVTGGSVQENGMTVHKTVRQDVESKTSSGVCVTCHSIINPIGFAFEHYDALGRWQTQETGSDAAGAYALDIDAHGKLPEIGPDGTQTGSVDVNGGVEMSAAIGASSAARACLTSHLFQMALRRVPVDQDLASVESATTALESGGTVRDLVVELITSNAFLHVRRQEGK
jgi:hypothetical protein